MKKIVIILYFLVFSNSYCQSDNKKVLFEIYLYENKPLSNGSIIVENIEYFIATEINKNGKAELNLKNFNDEVEILFVGPLIRFTMPEKTDLIKINVKMKKIIYYSESKILKQEDLDIENLDD